MVRYTPDMNTHTPSSIDFSKPFALALWWGGAKAYLHIGLLKALDEQWAHPSAISGTSMWALIGVAYAAWKTPDQIHDLCKKISYTKLYDFDSNTGMIKWDAINEFVCEFIGIETFEELPIPTLVTTTQSSDGAVSYHSSWLIAPILKATMALAWVFSPPVLAWERHIDGWVSENLPVQALADLGHTQILASSAMYRGSALPVETESLFGVTLPTSRLSFQKSVVSASTYILLKNQEDLMIKCVDTVHNDTCVQLFRPDVSGISMLDIKEYDTAIEIGYLGGKELIES